MSLNFELKIGTEAVRPLLGRLEAAEDVFPHKHLGAERVRVWMVLREGVDWLEEESLGGRAGGGERGAACLVPRGTVAVTSQFFSSHELSLAATLPKAGGSLPSVSPSYILPLRRRDGEHCSDLCTHQLAQQVFQSYHHHPSAIIRSNVRTVCVPCWLRACPSS